MKKYVKSVVGLMVILVGTIAGFGDRSFSSITQFSNLFSPYSQTSSQNHNINLSVNSLRSPAAFADATGGGGGGCSCCGCGGGGCCGCGGGCAGCGSCG